MKCLANKVFKNPIKVLEICLSEVVRIMNFLKSGKGQIKKSVQNNSYGCTDHLMASKGKT